MTDDIKALVERLREYSDEPEAADALTTLFARVAELEREAQPDDVAEFLERAEIASNELEDDGHYNQATVLNEAAALVNSQWREICRLHRRLETAHNAVNSIDKDCVAAQDRAEAAEAALAKARQAVHEASLFAAELAESIGPSDEWSEDFKAGYVFGGRDAARTIRQKCAFPDAIRAMKGG